MQRFADQLFLTDVAWLLEHLLVHLLGNQQLDHLLVRTEYNRHHLGFAKRFVKTCVS